MTVYIDVPDNIKPVYTPPGTDSDNIDKIFYCYIYAYLFWFASL